MRVCVCACGGRGLLGLCDKWVGTFGECLVCVFSVSVCVHVHVST